MFRKILFSVPLAALFLLLVSMTISQYSGERITVKGTVTDADSGEALIGVTILEKGTSNGIISDINGDFTIQTTPKSTLVFNYIGYQTKEVMINAQKDTAIQVGLGTDNVSLDEVVIVGYGRKSLGSKAQDAIAGKVSGIGGSKKRNKKAKAKERSVGNSYSKNSDLAIRGSHSKSGAAPTRPVQPAKPQPKPITNQYSQPAPRDMSPPPPVRMITEKDVATKPTSVSQPKPVPMPEQRTEQKVLANTPTYNIDPDAYGEVEKIVEEDTDDELRKDVEDKEHYPIDLIPEVEKPRLAENAYKPITNAPLSTFSIDVDNAAYSNIRNAINSGYKPNPQDVRIEEMINYFTYDYPQPKNAHPFTVTTEMADCPWNKDHKMVMVGLQGKKIDMDLVPPNNIVFLLDVSGSMNQANKLPLLKRAFALLVDQMRPEDRVAIVVYAGAAGVVLEPTPGNQKQKILAAMNNLKAGGSTAGGAGIEKAYALAEQSFGKQSNNRVILATDGDFNVGVSSQGGLVKLIEEKRKTGIYLTVLGFGTGNYQDAKMEELSNHGNGNYAYIDDFSEAKKVLVKEMQGTLVTIAKDVKLQVEFNPAQVASYRLVGYANRLLADADFNDDTKDAGEMGANHSVTALYEVVPKGKSLANLQMDKTAIGPYQPEAGADIDPLKYTGKNATGELLTVKMRYKPPHKNKSIKFESVLNASTQKQSLSKASENLRFATAVASFGQLLGNSQFNGNMNYADVIKLAESAKGKDAEGYRAGLVRMVKKAEIIK